MENSLLLNVVYNLIENRVYKFTYNEIFEEIKNKLISIRIFNVSKIINSYDFKDSILEALDYYMDLGVISKIGDYYVPVETYLYKEYNVNSNVMAYSYGYKHNGYFDIDSIKETLVDVDSCSDANKMTNDINKFIVLVGDLLDDGLWDVSEVSFDEVSTLYHLLKEQGASEEERVQYILNYYNAVKSENKKFPNRYVITPHVKRLTKRK